MIPIIKYGFFMAGLLHTVASVIEGSSDTTRVRGRTRLQNPQYIPPSRTDRTVSWAFTILLFTLLLYHVSGTLVNAANEQRCTDLGADCICSEPLNTNSYVRTGSSWFNPADTTTSDKQCQFISSLPGSFIGRNASDVIGVSSGPAIAALPAGHSVTFVGKAADNHTGLFNVSHNNAQYSSVPTARRAFRMYVFYSSNFQFTTGTCANSGKLYQLSEIGGGILTRDHGVWHIHAWGFSDLWSHGAGFTCCYVGPGDDYSVGPTLGAWHRFEVVFRNLPGPQLRIEIYMKNVTAGTAEHKIIDSAIPTVEPVSNQWGTAQATGLSLNSAGWFGMFDLFRNGTCAGYYALSHYLGAAWSTDSGQRIGAASEVEGGGGPAPSTSTLTFASSGVAGVSITGVTTDKNGLGNGTTSFQRTYDTGTSASGTTPTTSGGGTFVDWSGGCATPTSLTCTITVSSDLTVTANYTPPASPTPPDPPTGLQIQQGNQGASTVAYTATWTAGNDPPGGLPVTAFNCLYGYSSGEAQVSSTTCTTPFAFTMPYHSSGNAAGGFFCVWDRDDESTLSTTNQCGGLTVPSVAPTPPPVPPASARPIEGTVRLDGGATIQ